MKIESSLDAQSSPAPPLTFWDQALQHATENPRKIALVDYETSTLQKRRQFTYQELVELTSNLALGFYSLGVRRGDRVAVQLPNCYEFVLVDLACTRLGAVCVPIPAIYRAREVGYILGLTGAKGVVVPKIFRSFDHLAMLEALRPGLPHLAWVLVAGDSQVERENREGEVLSFRCFLEQDWAKQKSPNEIATLKPNELAAVIFTSGTTAEPKGAMHTPGTLVGTELAVSRRMELTSEDVLLSPSPFGHFIGYSYGMQMPLALGAKLVCLAVWNSASALGLIEREQVTFSLGSTPFLLDLTRSPEVSRHDLSSFRLFRCGGAPIPSSLVQEAQRTLAIRVLPGWGLTEVGTLTSCSPHDPDEKTCETDGYPLPGMAVQVRDSSFGRELPEGTEGELVAKTYTQMVGYFGQRELTRESYTEDGWFKTGDRGIMDKNGYVRLTGRSKDIIVRGGVNISAVEVEGLLLQHPQISRTALVAVPDPRLGERSCAFVVPRSEADFYSLTLEQICRFLSQQGIATQKLPDRLEVVKELPMTSAGKVQKYLLRQQLMEELKKGV
jgi:cyclohexanecarboxylate-CoA ligase